jgi:hypothetical protein
VGTPEDMLSMALEMGVCFHTGPVLGNMGGRFFPRTFERMVTFLFYQNFYEEFETCKRRIWKRSTLSTRAPVGEPEGGSFTGTF